MFLKPVMPGGFVYVTDVVPEVILEIRYYSGYNFIGGRIKSYNAPVAVLSCEAAERLKCANDLFMERGYVIKIFDAYRPESAVNDFVSWGRDVDNIVMKDYFFSDVSKDELFDLGYIAKRSSHSRGSTVDLTIVSMKTGKELDMGSPFDFFGEISHHGAKFIAELQKDNRQMLKGTMEESGFESFETEWWHYTLKNEPYPDEYFDFPVDFCGLGSWAEN
ncbi:D-alanyl-D-alanine dipeptidase [Clostridia bacterium]|nr:D-alanyl-D-alanine dipeptidase [Clostridia bacterium]